MPRFTLYKESVNLLNELKSTIDGSRQVPDWGNLLHENVLTVIISSMFLHYR